jgi:hypothetical protein
MVTKDLPITFAFTLAVTRLHNGAAMATLMREDGQVRHFTIPLKKLTVLKALDPTAKSAIEFLLGEA